MEQTINWIISNKEWLFSGIAVAILGVFWKWLYPFFNKRNSNVDKLSQSQNNSQTQNVTVNLAQPSIAPVMSNDEIKEDSPLTIDGIRAQTTILFIDDDKEFKIVPILRKAGWKNTSFFPNADVKDINAEKSEMLISYSLI